MKKQLLVSTLALLVIGTTCATTKAENAFKKGLGTIGSQVTLDAKSIGNDLKTSVKKDVDNSVAAAKKAKVAELTKIKDEKIKPLSDKIAAKKAEIDKIKKANMTETEKAARLALPSRELAYLESQKARIDKTFEDQIKALK